MPEPLPRPTVRVGWRWRIKPWRSARPSWGLEVLRRPRFKHSQVRLHLGRWHLTLMAFRVGGPHA
jgi:hypothetical protein